MPGEDDRPDGPAGKPSGTGGPDSTRRHIVIRFDSSGNTRRIPAPPRAKTSPPRDSPNPSAPARPRRVRRWRTAVLMVLLAILGLNFLASRLIVSRHVNLRLVATPGLMEVELGPHEDEVTSPACGCRENPKDAAPWYGFALPSRGFELDVRRHGGDGWALQATTPPVGLVNWFHAAGATFEVAVWLEGEDTPGRGDVVFRERVVDVVVLADGPVEVEHDYQRNPYATFMPAHRATTRFRSTPETRPGAAGQLALTSTTPARERAEFVDGPIPAAGPDGGIPEVKLRRDAAVALRAPMVDVIGPSVTLTAATDQVTGIFPGGAALGDLPPGREVAILIRSTFAVRLAPFPAMKPYGDSLRDDDDGAGISVFDGALPQFETVLSDLEVPDEDAWRKFVRRSAAGETVHNDIEPISEDDRVAEFSLPPVVPHRQVTAFGRLRRVVSRAVAGDVVVDAAEHSIARGAGLDARSDEGLANDRYQQIPVASLGAPTTAIDVAGSAEIRVADEVKTRVAHVSTITWFVLAALATLLIEIVVRELWRR